MPEADPGPRAGEDGRGVEEGDGTESEFDNDEEEEEGTTRTEVVKDPKGARWAGVK